MGACGFIDVMVNDTVPIAYWKSIILHTKTPTLVTRGNLNALRYQQEIANSTFQRKWANDVGPRQSHMS